MASASLAARSNTVPGQIAKHPLGHSITIIVWAYRLPTTFVKQIEPRAHAALIEPLYLMPHSYEQLPRAWADDLIFDIPMGTPLHDDYPINTQCTTLVKDSTEEGISSRAVESVKLPQEPFLMTE